MVSVTSTNPQVQEIVPTRNAQLTKQTAATIPVQQDNTLAEGDQYQTYTVVKGDTLWDISARKLGNPTKWPEIFNLNRNQIQNANLIYPQQILRLPIAQHDPVTVQPPVDEVVVPHEPVTVQPPVDEVVVPHEPVTVQPPVDEVVVPHEPVTVQPPVDEVISPTRPGQAEPQPSQPVQTNPGFPNIVPVRGNDSTVVIPQPNQPNLPSPIQPIGNQPQQPGGMPINGSRGLHRAAGVGGLLGSALAGGMIYNAASKIAPPAANFGRLTIVSQKFASGLAKMGGPGYFKTMSFINKIGGPKVAVGAAVIGAGIVGAGIAAGGYKLFSND